MVRVAGVIATKPASMVADDAPLDLLDTRRRFVSRGGAKLDAALKRFGIDPSGLHCLDAGASTGGFTDALLQRGAAHVIAVDVGYGQLAWSLRSDARVTVMERTNVRDLLPAALPYRAELVVADLSFVSLRTVLPNVRDLMTDDGRMVVLVKPQFEVGRSAVGQGGVVRDPVEWQRVLDQVVSAAGALGLGAYAAMASPVLGPAGNVEFFLALRSGDPSGADIASAVAQGEALRP